MSNKVWFYCWSWPGTIRMIKLKFFNPPIDKESILNSCDIDYLTRLKQLFWVTDFWTTYSWWFNNQTEKQDGDWFISKINNFKKVWIRLHAYIQWPNLVYDDFQNKNWFAKDNKWNLIPYHRWRKVVCLNNLEFQEYILQKVEEICKYDIDGVFIDNVQMWKLWMPIHSLDNYYFVGCNCDVCQQKFYKRYKEKIPLNKKYKKQTINNYLDFRVDSSIEFMTKISNVCKKYNKLLWSNSFDPKYNSRYVYGTDLKKLEKIQNYLLFENLKIPYNFDKSNNSYISKIKESLLLKKELFIVSYKKWIWLDSQFSQQTINNIFTESKIIWYNPCIKWSEFVTKKVWHNMRLWNYKNPIIDNNIKVIKTRRWTRFVYKFVRIRPISYLLW